MRLWLGMCLLGGLGLSGCQQAGDSPAAPAAAAAPSQTLSNFELRDMRGGDPSMVLVAKVADLFEEKQVTTVQSPEVVFYKDQKPSSRLRAPSGQVFMDTHVVEAWGGVTVVTVDSATLTTERLRYDPALRKIFSNDPVMLVRPGSTTRGEGLEADPELTRVKILRQKATFSEAAKP